MRYMSNSVSDTGVYDMEVNSVSMVSNVKSAPKGDSQSLYMPNYRNSLSADTVSFTGKKKVDESGKPKKSGFVHKALIAATNCFCPGLGQAINGQWGKAAMFAIGAPLATFGIFCANPAVGLAVGAASAVWMFVDAYRNA